MALIFLILAVLLTDLGIKSVIEESDPADFPKELPGSKGMIMLHRNHNEGFPMGALKNRPQLVKNLPAAVLSAVAGIFFWIYPQKGHCAEKIGTSLILGGGFSNLYDRIKKGYVVDYFSVRIKGVKNVVFNLGDICIFAGGFLLLVSEIIRTVQR